MDIKLEFNNGYGVSFTLGDYKLRGIKEAATTIGDKSKDKVPYSYSHPFPYMAAIFLPSNKEERMAIYKFISSNREKIEHEYGLVFEFTPKKGDLKDYQKECNILGVDITASSEDVRNKYRESSLKWHPDRWITEEEKKIAEDKFKEISSAYEVLRNVDTEDVDINMYVTDLNAKKSYQLYESMLVEQRKERIGSLHF